jgi:hypothetical protein
MSSPLSEFYAFEKMSFFASFVLVTINFAIIFLIAYIMASIVVFWRLEIVFATLGVICIIFAIAGHFLAKIEARIQELEATVEAHVNKIQELMNKKDN